MSNIIVDFAASEQLVGTAWSKLIEHVAGQSVEAVTLFIEAQETEFRDLTGVTRMPSTWRSAKAVVLNALRNTITITPGTGKTALEKATKAARHPRMLELAEDEKTRNLHEEFMSWYYAAQAERDALEWAHGILSRALEDR